jgi:hypothetical protein
MIFWKIYITLENLQNYTTSVVSYADWVQPPYDTEVEDYNVPTTVSHGGHERYLSRAL